MTAICNECGRSVAWRSGRYVNRIPDLNSVEVRKEMGKPFPEGDYVCEECDMLIRDVDDLEEFFELLNVIFADRSGPALKKFRTRRKKSRYTVKYEVDKDGFRVGKVFRGTDEVQDWWNIPDKKERDRIARLLERNLGRNM